MPTATITTLNLRVVAFITKRDIQAYDIKQDFLVNHAVQLSKTKGKPKVAKTHQGLLSKMSMYDITIAVVG